MKLLNIFKKAEQLRFAVILLAAGLLISIISAIILLAPDGSYAKVDAVISSIEQFGEGDDAEYSVTVTYTVDGREYKSELGAYDSRWSEGDTIECEYNLDNHAVIRLNSGKLTAGILCAAGIAAVIIGVVQLVRGIKKPAESYSQYNRVDEQAVDPALADEVRSNNEPMNDYVFHFTGKLNQSYIMKDKFGTPVYESVCDGITLVKATPFTFRNLRTGASSEKMIGHTVTKSIGHGDNFSIPMSSAFAIDGKNNWDYLAEQGYGFDFGPALGFVGGKWAIFSSYVGGKSLTESYFAAAYDKFTANGGQYMLETEAQELIVEDGAVVGGLEQVAAQLLEPVGVIVGVAAEINALFVLRIIAVQGLANQLCHSSSSDTIQNSMLILSKY